MLRDIEDPRKYFHGVYVLRLLSELALKSSSLDYMKFAKKLCSTWDLDDTQQEEIFNAARGLRKQRNITQKREERYGLGEGNEVIDSEGLFKVVYKRIPHASVTAKSMNLFFAFYLSSVMEDNNIFVKEGKPTSLGLICNTKTPGSRNALLNVDDIDDPSKLSSVLDHETKHIFDFVYGSNPDLLETSASIYAGFLSILEYEQGRDITSSMDQWIKRTKHLYLPSRYVTYTQHEEEVRLQEETYVQKLIDEIKFLDFELLWTLAENINVKDLSFVVSTETSRNLSGRFESLVECISHLDYGEVYYPN